MKEKLVSAKNAVARNKTKILVGALVVTTTTTVILFKAAQKHNDFLTEKGLIEEYYATDEE